MALERFIRFSRIENKTAILQKAVDVARFSFVVHNSISYLDLGISENSENRSILSEKGDYLVLKHSIEFISTEEKCRKIFAPSRSFLYSLHLDLSKRREKSLKEDSSPYMEIKIPHIAKLGISRHFYINKFSEFIKEAMQVTDDKSRFLRLVLKIPLLKNTILVCRKPDIVDSFIDCFYPKISDSVLFEWFIENFNVTDYIYRYENPEIVEFLLYHTRNHGRELDEEPLTIPELTYSCIFDRYFLNICPILKYVDTPGVSSETFDSYILEIPSLGPYDTEEVITKCQKWMSRERIYLILISLWIFDQRNYRPQCHEAATEALRLIWNCSSQAYMNFKEAKIVFGRTHTYQKLRDMYEFYCSSIGEDHSYIESRPLTHLCRAIIRKSLCKNKIWIPEGLRLMHLPKSIESFLNLEK